MSNQFKISHAARLARLKLSKEEEAEFEPQLATILTYMDFLDEVDVSEVEPTSHATPIFAIPRKDEPAEGTPPECLEQNAPSFAQGQVRVPRVVES